MEPKKNQNIWLAIFMIIVFGAIVLQLTGVIDVTGLLNPNSPKYMKWWEVWQPVKNSPYYIPNASCPKTTCDITKHCCGYKGDEKNQLGDPAVSAVPIPMACPCPEDTNPTPLGVDRTAPGGPYNICGCKQANK